MVSLFGVTTPLTEGLNCCVFADVRAEKDRGVHLSHGLLRQHRHRPVGRPDHLQDQEELRLPAGHEVSLSLHAVGFQSRAGSTTRFSRL